VKTSRSAAIFKLERFDPATQPADRAGEVDAEYVNRAPSTSVNGVPIIKPPYGQLTALDMNRGTIAWQVTAGDSPALRTAAALKGAALPERLGAAGNPGVIVTRGGLVFSGGGDTALSAFDKTTGREVWRHLLPRETTGTPMTYRSQSGRQFVVIATGRGDDTALVAFALREEQP
jgi:quinoprotein glucose dehydrogenase